MTRSSAEELEKLLKRAEKRADGLRAMAENIIAADKKIIIEITATGDTPLHNEILRLSIIETDGILIYDSFFNPCKYNSGYIYSATGISPEKFVNAPFLDEQICKINKILLSANTIIGYNLGKTLAFLREACCVWRSDYDFISIKENFSELYCDEDNPDLKKCCSYFGYSYEADLADTIDKCKGILHCYNKMRELNDLIIE